MYKKAVLRGLLGYIAGCMIGLFFALQREHFTITAALSQILLGGIPGAIACGSTVIYDIEKWSLLRATFTHFLVVIGVTFLACFVLNWFPPWSTAFWIMLAVEVIGYIIIWLMIYLRYKAEVRNLNKLLEEKHKTGK